MKIENKIEDETFEAGACDDSFVISIKEESNCSNDGGYTFEMVENSFALNRDQARCLFDEIQDFLKARVDIN